MLFLGSSAPKIVVMLPPCSVLLLLLGVLPTFPPAQCSVFLSLNLCLRGRFVEWGMSSFASDEELGRRLIRVVFFFVGFTTFPLLHASMNSQKTCTDFFLALYLYSWDTCKFPAFASVEKKKTIGWTGQCMWGEETVPTIRSWRFYSGGRMCFSEITVLYASCDAFSGCPLLGNLRTVGLACSSILCFWT